MAEPKQDKSGNVLTDKDKFQEDQNKEKVGHMGDKPNQSQGQPSPKPQEK